MSQSQVFQYLLTNLRVSFGDPEARSFFCVQGEKGSGKTFLLNRLAEELKKALSLIAYPNFHYLPTHRYIEEIIKVHFLNFTQMKLSLLNPPSTKKTTPKKVWKYTKYGCLFCTIAFFVCTTLLFFYYSFHPPPICVVGVVHFC